jgi:putative transposase
MKSPRTTKTLHLRIKDRHAQVLRSLACEVNMVWNYCNELSFTHTQRTGKFFSSYDLQNYTKGATKEGLKLNSASLQMIGAEYVARRKQFKKVKLNWRVSNPKSSKRSLGWIPFRHDCINYAAGQIQYAGIKLGLWDSYGLSSYELGSGSISEDARGRWYLNITVASPGWPKSVDLNQVRTEAIGIDLGLKDLIACSDGFTVEAQQFYRDLEPKLAVAQRAGKKARVKSIHAKIANRRKDQLHKLTTSLVGRHQAIFVGDVSSSQLVKTTMAKSVLDAGWSAARTMLKYKCDDAGVWFKEINESYSTQECSSCGARTGPKGLNGLNERTWTCSVCLTHHDRDLNSAKVIKARGLVWLEAEFQNEISTTREAKAGEAVVNKGLGTQCAESGIGLIL